MREGGEKEIQYSKREGREEMEKITTKEQGKGMGDLGKEEEMGGGGRGRNEMRGRKKEGGEQKEPQGMKGAKG
jgi:hypothetical protein